MTNIIFLILAVLLMFLTLTIITKHINSNYPIVICFLMIMISLSFGVQLYEINELLFYCKIAYEKENLFIICFFMPLLIIETIYFKHILLKTNIPKKEAKIVLFLEKFKLWKNKIFQKVISTLMIICSLFFATSLIVEKPINTITEIVPVKVIGIEYNESYTDERGTFHDEEYKFKFKYMNEEHKTSTINNNNFDKETLKRYYDVLKNNFEGVYSAKIEVTEYTDGSKTFSLKDILFE